MPVIVTNNGAGPAVGEMVINLYASQDGVLASPPDVLLGTATVNVKLLPGRSKKYSIKKIAVPDIELGQYALLADANATDTIQESNTDNNVAVSPVSVVWLPPLVVFTPPAILPPATVGLQYTYDFGAAGSTSGGIGAPYHYQLGTMGGFPPFGLTLCPFGPLSGVPTVPGKYSFTVCAVDSAGNPSQDQKVSILVRAEAEYTGSVSGSQAATIPGTTWSYLHTITGTAKVTLLGGSGTAQDPFTGTFWFSGTDKATRLSGEGAGSDSHTTTGQVAFTANERDITATFDDPNFCTIRFEGTLAADLSSITGTVTLDASWAGLYLQMSTTLV